MPQHDSDTAPEAGAADAGPIYSGVGVCETQGQTLLAVEPVNAFMIIPPALPPEHDVNPAVTIVDPGFGDLSDTEA